MALWAWSVEAAAPQVVSDDHIRDGVKHKLYVVGVSGAGLVGVHLLVEGLVLMLVLSLNVGRRLHEGVGTWGDWQRETGNRKDDRT